MQVGQYVRLTKISRSDNPTFPTANKEVWKSGEDNRFLTPPVDYTIEGYLLTLPEPGKQLYINRVLRNSTYAVGLFSTSIIASTLQEPDDRLRVETMNSVYVVEPAQEGKPNVS